MITSVCLHCFSIKVLLDPAFYDMQKLLQTLPYLVFVLREFLFSYMYITLLLHLYSFSLSHGLLMFLPKFFNQDLIIFYITFCFSIY